MIIGYKIVRYFVFLILLVITGLYFVKGISIPYLTSFYTAIDDAYYVLPSYFLESPEDEYQIDDYISTICQPFQDIMDPFFHDIALDVTLRSALSKNISDLEYLIAQYFSYRDDFLDIIIYDGKTILYKYADGIFPKVLSFSREVRIDGHLLTVQVIFRDRILQETLDNMKVAVVVYAGGRWFYSSQNPYLDQKKLELIARYQEHDNGEKVLNQHTILSIERSDYMTFFLLQQEQDPFIISIVRFFYLLIFPMVWILFFLLDRGIYNSLKNHVQQKELLSTMIKQGVDENSDLEWLDHFVHTEEFVEKEVDLQVEPKPVDILKNNDDQG